MNIDDWLPFLVAVTLGAISYLVPEKIKARITAPINRRLKPVVDRLFPAFRMDPWLFEPIAEVDLPAAQKKHFDAHTPGFLGRGFTHLGDFVLRRDPQPSCTRYFLSRDCTIIGGITCYLKSHTIECMSVLLNGLYLETANIRCSNLPPKEHGLQFFVYPTNDSIDLIEHHTACVCEAAMEANSQPATLQPSDLQAVCNYGRQLSLNSLHQQGVLNELPEFLQKQSTHPEMPA